MKCKTTTHKDTYLALYLSLLVFLFYEAKIKPELGTVEKLELVIVKRQETNVFVYKESFERLRLNRCLAFNHTSLQMLWWHHPPDFNIGHFRNELPKYSLLNQRRKYTGWLLHQSGTYPAPTQVNLIKLLWGHQTIGPVTKSRTPPPPQKEKKKKNTLQLNDEVHYFHARQTWQIPTGVHQQLQSGAAHLPTSVMENCKHHPYHSNPAPPLSSLHAGEV